MADRKTVTYGAVTWLYSQSPGYAVSATAGTTLTGASGANEALYGIGNSVLAGGGGGGDFTFFGGPTDRVIPNSADGVDTQVSYSGSLMLTAGVANGELEGAGTLTGNSGNNILSAVGRDAHVLVAGTGSDLLIGAAGAADRFIITKGGGSDAIQDFEHGTDVIQLNNYTNFAGGFASVQAAMSQQGSNVLLQLNGGQTLTLADSTISQFTASDFALPFSPAGLKMTFGDEFSSFNASNNGIGYTWKTDNSANIPAGDHELEYYGNQNTGTNPYSDSGGVLSITAKPASTPTGAPYVSGEINTQNSFSQTYGYFEMRAELPAGQGLWPAFWMVPADGSWPPELDIMEALGSDTSHIYTSTHSAVGGPNVVNSTAVGTPDFSTGYHVYGVNWAPDKVTFYVDGNAVSSIATPADMNKPMYLIADLAVGGNWPGSPGATTTFPATLKIDYIHAYATAATTYVNNQQNQPITLSGFGETLTKGDGNYTVSGTAGTAVVTLGNGNQTVSLTGDYNKINLGAGNQSVNVAGSYTTVVAGSGASVIHGGVNNVSITIGGTPKGGTTALYATGSSDTFTSTASGNVSVSGTTGYAKVSLAAGDDTVNVGGSGNSVTLGAGNSTVMAGASSNAIHTAGGNDTITVTGFKNILDAGPGTNVLNGGGGYDTFLLNGAGQGTDTITGFTVWNSDVLNLSRTVAGLGVSANLSNLGSVINTTVVGGDTAISVTPPGGSATTFALLKGVTTSVTELVAHNSVRIS